MRRCLLVAVLAVGCFGARPDATRLYVLTPITAADGAAAAGGSTAPVLGLGPITLPRYLERSEVVSRVGANEIRPSEFDRWAEPLHQQIARTLAEDLAVLGAVSRVIQHPWYRASEQDAVLELDVWRFERNLEGHALLAARWRLRCPAGGAPVHAEEISLADPAAASDAAAIAGALSRQVGELARRIAAALETRPYARCAMAGARDGGRGARIPSKP